MDIPAVTSRYARTLYDYAVEQDARDAVRADCRAIHQLIGTSPEFTAFIGNPTIPPDQARDAVSSLFRDQAHDVTHRFLGFLAVRGRLNLLEGVCKLYEERVCEELGIQKVMITAAHELTDTQLAAIQDRLATRYGKMIETEVMVDTSLIAGFRIQAGDRIQDLSMVSKLDQFEQSVINAQHEHDKLKG